MSKQRDNKSLFEGKAGGIILASGEEWREMRRWTISTLRDFGAGKNLMQQRILDEIEILFEDVDRGIAAGDDEQDLSSFIERVVGSMITAVLLGYRIVSEEQRAEFERLKTSVAAHVGCNTGGGERRLRTRARLSAQISRSSADAARARKSINIRA